MHGISSSFSLSNFRFWPLEKKTRLSMKKGLNLNHLIYFYFDCTAGIQSEKEIFFGISNLIRWTYFWFSFPEELFFIKINVLKCLLIKFWSSNLRRFNPLKYLVEVKLTSCFSLKKHSRWNQNETKTDVSLIIHLK